MILRGDWGRISANISMKKKHCRKNLLITIEATFLLRFSSNSSRMFILVISRLSSELGHVGSETRSLGQIIEKTL